MSAALQLNIEPEAVEQAPTHDRKEIVTELMNVRR